MRLPYSDGSLVLSLRGSREFNRAPLPWPAFDPLAFPMRLRDTEREMVPTGELESMFAKKDNQQFEKCMIVLSADAASG